MRLNLRPFVGVLCLLLLADEASAQTSAPAVLKLTEREAVTQLMTRDPRVRALGARVTKFARSRRNACCIRTRRRRCLATRVRHERRFLVARQEVPISTRRRHLQAAGRSATDSAAANARRQIVELQAAVRDAYTDLLVAREREGVLRTAIEGLQKLIATLRIREEAGEGSRYDRLRGERALVDLEADLALAGGLRAQAQGVLAGFLGPDVVPESLIAADALDAPAPPQALPTLISNALANRGDYRATQISIEQFEAERRAATQLRVPTPIFAGGLKHSNTSIASSSGYQFSIDVALPLFSRGQAATAVATAQKARAELETDSSRIRIEAEVRATHALLAVHRDRAARYRESAAAIADPLASTGRVGYEEGELSILELLDAERQALDARLRILDLTAAARHAAIDLDRAIGLEWRP